MVAFANDLAEEIWTAKYRHKAAAGGDGDYAATIARVAAAVAEAEASEHRAYGRDRGRVLAGLRRPDRHRS